MKKIFIALVRGYQLIISPFLGSNCRFYPTCSHYMIQAIEQHGGMKGVYLGIRRLSKCHPWHEGGIDPVPSCQNKNQHGVENQKSDEKSQRDQRP